MFAMPLKYTQCLFTFVSRLLLIFAAIPVLQINSAAQTDNYSWQLCWDVEREVFDKFDYASDKNIKNDPYPLIFFYDIEGNLYALSPKNGKTEWRTEIGGEPASEILQDSENLYFLTKADRVNNGIYSYVLRSMRKETGIIKWQASPVENSQLTDFLLMQKERVFLLDKQGVFYGFDIETGKETDQIRTFHTPVTRAMPDEKYLYYGAADGKIITVNLEDKSFTETQPKTVPDLLIIASDRLVISDKPGNVLISDNWRKSFKRFRAGAGITNFAASEDTLFISSKDNYIYAVNYGGKRIWKKRFSGRSKVYFSRNYNVLFAAQLNSNEIFTIDPQTGKVTNTIRLPDTSLLNSEPYQKDNLMIFQAGNGLFAYSAKGCPIQIK